MRPILSYKNGLNADTKCQSGQWPVMHHAEEANRSHDRNLFPSRAVSDCYNNHEEHKETPCPQLSIFFHLPWHPYS